MPNRKQLITGLMSTLGMGGAPAESAWPEMDRAITHLSKEMPAEVDSMKDRQIRPMGRFEKGLNNLVRPGIAASTSPWGNIAYDRDAIQAAHLRPEDVLAHELTHVRQIDRGGGMLRSLAKTLTGNTNTAYGDRDFEQEALGVEMSRLGRRKRLGDIALPPPERGK